MTMFLMNNDEVVCKLTQLLFQLSPLRHYCTYCDIESRGTGEKKIFQHIVFCLCNNNIEFLLNIFYGFLVCARHVVG